MRTPFVALFLALVALPCAAEDPAAALARLSPGQWLEYEVPIADPGRAPCCFDFDGKRVGHRGCRLAHGTRSFGTSSEDPPPAPGEALRVLLRRGSSSFDRAIAVGTSCPVDAQGAVLVSIRNVSPADSARLLVRGAQDPKEKARSEGLSALAHQAGSDATVAMLSLTTAANPKPLRRDAYFWLAQARGGEGLAAVERALEGSERDDELRRHLVFCLSQSSEAGATRKLVALAREHGEDEVRGEALFWLAQKKAPEVEAIVRHAVDHDPSRSVRKKAVFALSQLPAKRAVASLREIVESSRPREIRREALFWLAQADGDEALPVFDKLFGE